MSAYRLLIKLGATCFVFDDNKSIMEEFCKKESCEAFEPTNDIEHFDFLVLSPGVSVEAAYIQTAKSCGVKIISELELGAALISGNLVGITGTNGKTTTCSLVFHILQFARKKAVLCGNIGEPITSKLTPEFFNYIVEMSSFQLETSNNLKPHISAITNITPNHIDRHQTFEKYVSAKLNIFKNATKKDVLVLNHDDPTLQSLDTKNIKPKIIWISIKDNVNGYFIKNKKVFFKNRSKEENVLTISTTLLGAHNLYNILFAIAICRELGVAPKTIEKAIETFSPIKHRLQFVKNVNGVSYYNDSKSTTPESTINAINSFGNKPLILLLGGSDKKTPFDNLANNILKRKNIKLIIIYGATASQIVSTLSKLKIQNYIVAKDFFSALHLATNNATKGDTVLLSPACASFDAFSSFEERGNKFCEYVNDIKQKA
ncbi:MAG: UDP-N-acetylmuramoyl-L-alanine--D-glutamate ligase [Clostridia bacterium]|nr:UDP-N-acetylmuramoyl-L-alanine--D-glutamate ligase [Clostridia bacterium]